MSTAHIAASKLLSIAQVAERKSMSIAGVLRWALDGLLLADGSRVHLATTRRGWRRFVSEEQLAAFDAAIAADDAQRIAARDTARRRRGEPTPRRRESDALESQRRARELLAARG